MHETIGRAARGHADTLRGGRASSLRPTLPALPTTSATTHEVETPHGQARVHLLKATAARGSLVLGHGAGGGVSAPDLVAATEAARSERVSVALVEQPYRVAGRRSPAPAHQLDAAWIAVVERLRADELRALPLVTGGRSSGARVACRTAEATGACAVLCLAFPLQPPARVGAAAPPPTRLPELEAVNVPVLIVQGANDRFGVPAAAPGSEVVTVRGDHSLRSDRAALAAAVRAWLAQIPFQR
jgi:predicted alpha/beta-hydrolase family hydrolase